MDEISSVVKKSLCFTRSVQSSCDNQRKALEMHFKNQLGIHVKELNKLKEQNEKEKSLNQEDAEPAQENHENSDCEELELADKLLRKARYIREKYKVPDVSKDISSPVEISTIPVNHVDETECLKVNGTNECKVRQSHSAPLMCSDKTRSSRTKKPSVLLTDETLQKTSKFCSESNIPVRTDNKLGSDSERKIGKSADSVVLSKEKFLLYKTLKVDVTKNGSKVALNKSKAQNFPVAKSGQKLVPVPLNKSNKKLKEKLNNVKSVYASTNLKPSPISARQALRCCNDIPFQNEELKVNFRNYFWYPFITSENKRRLTVNVRCNSKEEFNKILSLCHNIQETMFWIDLFSQIGKELAGVLQRFDQKDRKLALFISYLQSLFHAHLQRIPVIIRKAHLKNIDRTDNIAHRTCVNITYL